MINFLKAVALYKKKREIPKNVHVVVTIEKQGFRVYVATKEDGPDGYPRVAEGFVKYDLIEKNSDETGLALLKHEIDHCITILRGTEK